MREIWLLLDGETFLSRTIQDVERMPGRPEVLLSMICTDGFDQKDIPAAVQQLSGY
jgi:hypothetical protein